MYWTANLAKLPKNMHKFSGLFFFLLAPVSRPYPLSFIFCIKSLPWLCYYTTPPCRCKWLQLFNSIHQILSWSTWLFCLVIGCNKLTSLGASVSLCVSLNSTNVVHLSIFVMNNSILIVIRCAFVQLLNTQFVDSTMYGQHQIRKWIILLCSIAVPSIIIISSNLLSYSFGFCFKTNIKCCITPPCLLTRLHADLLYISHKFSVCKTIYLFIFN